MRQRKIRIGIVGCGAIGTFLAERIFEELKKAAVLSALYDLDAVKSSALAAKLKSPRLFAASRQELIGKSDLVVEAASAAVSAQVAAAALAAGKDCLIMSVGGLLSDYPRLFKLARRKRCRIFIPSGAVAGIDAIKSLAAGKIQHITLTTFKPPSAFSAAPYILKHKINLNGIKTDRVLFKGSVACAVKNFPQNINVAATLSLASQAADKLVVRIIASPKCRNNIHQIEVMAEAGKLLVRTENLPSLANPKTSMLAMLSALVTLRGALDEVKIGT